MKPIGERTEEDKHLLYRSMRGLKCFKRYPDVSLHYVIYLMSNFTIKHTASLWQSHTSTSTSITPQLLGRETILIPGFVRSTPMLAIYDVAHSLPLRGVYRDFPITEDETKRHVSHLSGTFGKKIVMSL